MNGQRVFRQGGPSWVPYSWRRKHPDWELWATSEGLEVKRGGQIRWGVKVDE